MSTVVLTVVAAKVAGTETNFPVLITPSLISGLGSISLPNAQSSRIYADVTKLVEQAREVVGADEIHTKIAALTTTSACYFDYDGIRADYSVSATYGRNNVWSDYQLVAQLEDLENSTGGTDLNNVGSTPFGAGYAGNGAQFNTTNNRKLDAASAYGLDWANSYTWQIHIKVNAFSGDKYVLDHTSTAGNKRLILYTTASSTIKAFFNGNEIATSSLSTATWYKLTAVKDGSTMRYYLGATSQGTTTLGALSYINNVFGIGAANDAFTVNGNCTIDLTRLRATALSANWVTTEYNNQNDNAAFWTAAAGGGPVQNSNFLAFMA